MTRDADQAKRPDGQGWALARLIGIHDGMRADLARLRGMVMAGAPRLPWADCITLCRFVHQHHQTEDAMLFPQLVRRLGGEDPALQGVVDELVADHRALAADLEEVERALAAPPGDGAARDAAGALERLSEHLEAHLGFEEERLGPALNRLSSTVAEEDFPAPRAGRAT
jgi:hemerythrin-like domain-containing protein